METRGRSVCGSAITRASFCGEGFASFPEGSAAAAPELSTARTRRQDAGSDALSLAQAAKELSEARRAGDRRLPIRQQLRAYARDGRRAQESARRRMRAAAISRACSSRRECDVVGIDVNPVAAEEARKFCTSVVVADLDEAMLPELLEVGIRCNRLRRRARASARAGAHAGRSRAARSRNAVTSSPRFRTFPTGNSPRAALRTFRLSGAGNSRRLAPAIFHCQDDRRTLPHRRLPDRNDRARDASALCGFRSGAGRSIRATSTSKPLPRFERRSRERDAAVRRQSVSADQRSTVDDDHQTIS